MDLHPQVAVDTLVAQHKFALGYVHAYIEEAVLDVASRWADRYPLAADLSGTTRCTCVRQMLLSLEDEYLWLVGTSLGMYKGRGMSVQLRDVAGTMMRVRRFPTDNFGDRLREVQCAPPDPSIPRKLPPPPEGQLEIGDLDGQPSLAPPGPGWAGDEYDLFVLWWLHPDQVGLAGAALAAVADIDDPKLVRIFATAELPPPLYGRKRGHTGPPTPSGPAAPPDVYPGIGDEGTETGSDDPDAPA